MGTGETGTPTTKAAKLSFAQDQQGSYPEWAAAFQAYYNSGGQPPHGYFPPSVASGPQSHPYMWGAQPMMPPYGAPPPPPYGAIYPHGGVYGHPVISPGSHTYAQFGIVSPGTASEGTTAFPAGVESDGNNPSQIAKERSPIHRSKGGLGGLGLPGNKGSDPAKGNSGSANGVLSQSGESASESSSEGSEEDNTENILQKRGFEGITVDAGDGANSTVPSTQGRQDLTSRGDNIAGVQSATAAQVGAMSKISSSGSLTTNLGIGIQDYWSGSTRGSLKGGKRTSASTSVMVPTTTGAPFTGPVGREGVPPELWLQDEREVKRQRRKQSNRESARRSRLRKQAECEELGTRVDTLMVENIALRTELSRLSEECKKLTAENSSLLGQLQKSQEIDLLVPLDQEGVRKCEVGVKVDGNGRTSMDMKRPVSPPMHAARANAERSCDSTGKIPSPLESVTCPATIAQG